MSDPREIELKLDVPMHSVSRLSGSSLLKGEGISARKPSDIVSVYFDTASQKLRRKGLTLRVRRIGRRFVQTVKQERGGRGGLFDRGEWEQDIKAQQPDLDAAGGTALAPLLNKKLRRDLKPVFETRVRRRVIAVRSGDSDIEVAIDRGTVEADGKSTPLCEVELELKQGRAGDLFNVARALAADVPLQLAVRSKSDRGYALLAGEKLVAVKAGPVALTPEMDVQSAFRAIARTCLAQIVINQPVMLKGDAEGLHQMRVGLRRLRAAISLFSNILTDAQTAAIKGELKWIAGELGPARELDVFLKRVVRPISSQQPRSPGVMVISRELRQRREAAYARACAAAEDARYRNLVIDTAAWIEAGDWNRDPDDFTRALLERPIVATATDELQRRWKTIVKKGRRLAELDTNRRHKLRIQTKKLRYAAEFFAGAFPRRKATRRLDRFGSRLNVLQDALGDLNDIAVHEEMSERLVETEGSQRRRTRKAFAAGRLAGREEARIAPKLSEAESAYARFAKAKPFWI